MNVQRGSDAPSGPRRTERTGESAPSGRRDRNVARDEGLLTTLGVCFQPARCESGSKGEGELVVVTQSWCTARVAPTCSKRRLEAVSRKVCAATSTSTT